MLNAQRQFTTAYLFRVTPAIPGKYTLPPIAIRSRGVTHYTQPIHFQVHPLNSLFKLPTGIGNHQILTGWFPDKTTLYEKESCNISLKLYVPIQLPIALNGWGLPTPAKDNCLAWRFSFPKPHEISQVTIDGISYRTATFSTSLSGIRPGTATFGPAPMRIMVRQSVVDPLRGSRLTNTPIHLTLPATSFKILPLPKGAPPHFTGAVGQFSIQASCQKTDILENASTEVILNIRGSGNLETLHVPSFSEDTWKIIDSTKLERNTDRRAIDGTVTFRQLIRPKTNAHGALPETIPSYIFSYFDPSDHAYHTITTPPIPVHITPSPKSEKQQKTPPAVSEKLGTAPEEMRDILGFINLSDSENFLKKNTSHHRTFSWIWHLIPASLAFIVLITPLLKKIKTSRSRTPDAIARKKELANLSQESNLFNFYRQAGRFIEQWLSPPPAEMSSDLQEVLAKRDSLCFKATNEPPKEISPQQKKAILALLKRASKLCLFLILFITSQQSTQANQPEPTPQLLHKAQNACQSGDYQQALTYYQSVYPTNDLPPSDILYNIGNCYYHLDQPGLAALAWRRVLIQDPTHPQAEQNLRFLEFNNQSIVPHYAAWQRHLLRFPPSTYSILFYVSIWIFVLSLLTLIVLRPQRKLAILNISLIVLSPITASLGWMAQHWYPDDHLFAPISQQALVLKKTTLYPEPHHQTNHSTELPPATLLRIDATRGPWIHVSTCDQHQGWLPKTEIAPIIPPSEETVQ